MPNILQFAKNVYAWALENNLFVTPTSEVHASQLLAGANSSQTGFDDCLPILKNRGISLISYNDRDSILYIHTSGKLNQKEKNRLPESTDGIRIKFLQTKPLSIGMPTSSAPVGTWPYALHNNRYTCGSSISIGNYRDAGTLGCLIEKDGARFGLSNNHVVGGCNNTKIGTPVVAPGTVDQIYTSIDPFTIGRFSDVHPMVQGDPAIVNYQDNMDAGRFELRNMADLSSMQGTWYDTPSSVLDPAPGMTVEKVGRTTRLTKGLVLSKVFLPLMVHCAARSYPSANEDEAVTFQGPVYFDRAWVVQGNGQAFSLGGDSGSLVVHEDSTGTKQAVGIVFAGNPSHSFILPIRPILDHWGASLVHGYNV